MIFASYRNRNGNEAIGIVSSGKKHIYPLRKIGFRVSAMLDLIEDYTEDLRDKLCRKIQLTHDVLAVEDVELLAPIPHPRHDFLCV